MLSKKFLKQGRFEIDNWLTVRFQIDDQDAVDVPDLLNQALSQEPQAKATWDRLSPGKRRGLAYRVSSAKTEPTQMRRVAKVIEMLVLGEF
ncbi:MAG: YdeI/OmpD-associated family protein [Cyanobacteria bacterium P01_D01_bin.105]